MFFSIIIFVLLLQDAKSLLTLLPKATVSSVSAYSELPIILANEGLGSAAHIKPASRNQENVFIQPESPLHSELSSRGNLFDITFNVCCKSDLSAEMQSIQKLVSATPFEADWDTIVKDIEGVTSQLLQQGKLTCRLALMEGVRCPKWHQDYVQMRLIKHYMGPGTEWVKPGDVSLRMSNQLRKMIGADVIIHDKDIQQCQPGEAILISGKIREDKAVPVLHRSPPCTEETRRLLYTVTV